MRIEKHLEALREVLDCISSALEDRKGLVFHQRRLMAMLSLGVPQLIEIYLHKKGAIGADANIKHEWFSLSGRNLKAKFESILTKNVEKLDGLLVLARKIEDGRNEIVYGAPLGDGRILREKIDLFLELKETVEREAGVKIA